VRLDSVGWERLGKIKARLQR